MLHAKFQDNRTLGSGEDFKGFNRNGLSGYLGHKSAINYVICCKVFPLDGFVTVFSIQTPT